MRRLLLRLLPSEWREPVVRDLEEEVSRTGRRGVSRELWFEWQLLRVMLRFRLGQRRHVRAPRQWGRQLFGHLGADVRLALRMIRRQPWPAVAIVVTLGVGIGATTATYAIFNHILFRPTPGVSGADRIVTVYFQPPGQPTTRAYGDRSALPAMRAAATTTLEVLGDAPGETAAITTASGAEPFFASVQYVSSQYFAALGVRARLGRLIRDDEADTPGHDVAVVSERLWRRDYGASPSVIGRTLHVNDRAFTIVGVIDQFQGWGTTQQGNEDVWVPIAHEADETTSTLVGRLKPSASMVVASQQITSGYEASVAAKPGIANYVPVMYPGLFAFGAAHTRDNALPIFRVLMAAVMLLLVIACVNAANLLLARALSRQQDTAMRQALGAGRLRVFRQFLVEALLLAALACGLGLFIAALVGQSFVGTRVISMLPELDALELDRRVLLFCAAITTATVILFGAVPAMLASSTNLRGAIGGLVRSTPSRRRVRATLSCLQVALSLALVASALVLNRSLARLTAVDLGMRIDRTIAVELSPYKIGYKNPQSQALYRDVMDRLRVAGFSEIAFTAPGPLGTSSEGVQVVLDSAPDAVIRGSGSRVSPGYFALLDIPIVAGRTFTDAEFQAADDPAPLPLVANVAMSRVLFGAAPAVGGHVTLLRRREAPVQRIDAEIVGVVGDTKSSAVREAPAPRLYNPRRSAFAAGTLLVNARGPMPEAMTRIRGVVRELVPSLPVPNIGPLESEVAEALSAERVLARLGVYVAVLAALLATSGVFAVVTFVVAERTREFGIRIALGAPRTSIAQSVLRRTLAMAAVGIAVGLGTYGLGSRWLTSQLFGVSRLDPVALVVAILTLAGAAALAGWIPARRAMRVDPIKALRAE